MTQRSERTGNGLSTGENCHFGSSPVRSVERTRTDRASFSRRDATDRSPVRTPGTDQRTVPVGDDSVRSVFMGIGNAMNSQRPPIAAGSNGLMRDSGPSSINVIGALAGGRPTAVEAKSKGWPRGGSKNHGKGSARPWRQCTKLGADVGGVIARKTAGEACAIDWLLDAHPHPIARKPLRPSPRACLPVQTTTGPPCGAAMRTANGETIGRGGNARREEGGEGGREYM